MAFNLIFRFHFSLMWRNVFSHYSLAEHIPRIEASSCILYPDMIKSNCVRQFRWYSKMFISRVQAVLQVFGVCHILWNTSNYTVSIVSVLYHIFDVSKIVPRKKPFAFRSHEKALKCYIPPEDVIIACSLSISILRLTLKNREKEIVV